MQNDIARGNIQGTWLLGVALTPASVAAATTAEQSFTIPGLLLGDVLSVVKPTLQAGIATGNARVSAANTMALTFINSTAATAVVPTAGEVYLITVERPSYLPLPNAIQ